MAILPVLPFSDPVLRQKAKRVRRLDDRMQKLIDDMIETMHSVNGMGLAAPQVGVPLRLFVMQVPKELEGDPMAGQLIVMYNPAVIHSSGQWEPDEGCLSLPGYVGNPKRAEMVVVKGRDRAGKEIRIKAQGLLAQALQHEIEHLDGILYFDHLESLDQLRKAVPKEVAEGAAEISPEGEPEGEPARISSEGDSGPIQHPAPAG